MQLSQEEYEEKSAETRPDRPFEAPQVAEVAYFEKRAIKLMYQQVFQQMAEHNLTLFEDNIITAQIASIFLDFKSTQIGGNKFLVLPVDFLQAHNNDIDTCVRLLKASQLLPFETSEIKDFDNLVLVIGADNLPDNPPTLFIVRNLRQAENKTPVIHVWKSSESFAHGPQGGPMIKGGLTEREIQVQIMLRRILSHRGVSDGKTYTIETLPSHTMVIHPTWVDREVDTQEHRTARSLLQNASNLITKLKGTSASGEKPSNHCLSTQQKRIVKANDMHPSDEAYLKRSPMLTLLLGFLQYGLDPMSNEPRGSMSKVKSIREMTLSRQDVCDVVSEMRDLLYCIYDTDYFEFGADQKNQTLTQSMLIEQISMSPYRHRPAPQFASDEESQESDGFKEPRRVRKGRKQRNQKRRKRRNSSPSCGPERSKSRGGIRPIEAQSRTRSVTPELVESYRSPFARKEQVTPQNAPPYWSQGEEKEEQPEVLKAKPSPYQGRHLEQQQQSPGLYAMSPTKGLMDRHHDMDDLTAHAHEIQVYRPSIGAQDQEQEDTVQLTSTEKKGSETNNFAEANEYQMAEFYPERKSSECAIVSASHTAKNLKEKQDVVFGLAKGSLNPNHAMPRAATEPTTFQHFSNEKRGSFGGEGVVEINSRVETERSSAQFGDGTFDHLNSVKRRLSDQKQVEGVDGDVVQEPNRPPIFPDSYSQNVSNQQFYKKAEEGRKRITSDKSDRAGVHKGKSTSKERKGGAKCNSKVRRKGEAIIEQLLQTFTKQSQNSAQQEPSRSQKRKNQPQALRTQMRSSSVESDKDRTLQQLQQLAKVVYKKPRDNASNQATKATAGQKKATSPVKRETACARAKDGAAGHTKSLSKGKKAMMTLNGLTDQSKRFGEQQHPNRMTNLEQVASYTGCTVGKHPKNKLRFKKSPPREENSDNMIPQISNVRDKLAQTNPVQEERKQTFNQSGGIKNFTLMMRDESRSKSKESIEMGEEALHLQKYGDNMFDLKHGIPSGRTSLETKAPMTNITIQKSRTEKVLPPAGSGRKPISLTQQVMTLKKKSNAKKPRGNSKARLQLVHKTEKDSKQDESLRKRKEIIQELRLSAAKIVIESQQKAKKATKNRLREAQKSQTQLLQMQALNGNSLQLEQTPFALLARRTMLGADGHAPAVMSPKMGIGSGLNTGAHFNSQQVLPGNQNQRLMTQNSTKMSKVGVNYNKR